MRKTFFEKCGMDIDEMGDAGMRMKAVASELFSLSCYGDYIMKQAFVQTATGEYLDMHADIRNTSRKTEKKATVKLTFKIPEPLDTLMIIPRNTICSCSDNPYIQFATVRSAIIRAGESEAEAEAEALYANELHNVEAGKIDTLVNPPAGISSVINNSPATGGFSGENDEMLRKRLMKTYKVPSSGFSLISMASVIEAFDEVIECQIFKNNSVLDVYVKTPNNTVSQELRDKITDSLMVTELLGMSFNIIPCTPTDVSFTVKIQTNPRCHKEIEKQVEKVVSDIVSANEIGRSFELDRLVQACLRLEGIENVIINSNIDESGIIPLYNDSYLCLKSVEVTKDE